MVLKVFPRQFSKKAIVEINCNPCNHNASISNQECLKCISNKLKRESKELILIKGGFKKIYDRLDSKQFKDKKLIPKLVPSFIKSRIINLADNSFKTIEKNEKIDGLVVIKKKSSTIIYCLDPPETHLSMDEIKKVNGLIKDISNKEFINEDFKSAIKELLDKEPVSQKIKDIVKRHTIGFGLLDLLFGDEKIQDVFVDSPGSKLVHIVHSDYGECLTNLVLSKQEVSSIATKVRAVSGRPFDESFPVLHYDLKDYEIRICGICEPLTFNGIGYAFRKHRKVPWTVPQFINNGTLSPEAAGLINFLVDGQASILITGPRGSGKTSLLSALITEMPSSNRILLIEDTPEVPVNNLEQSGFKIQHVRIKPSSKENETSYELSAEEALRNSLRLGESVLIIGEVRGTEAKALFEAMRVGAAGNTVLGTIHGSSAYDTYDRIVNDLSVPKSSFKAADLIISCASLRIGESLAKKRCVTGITEVKKQWTNDPISEDGFFELAFFDRNSMKLSLNKDLNQSDLIKKVSELKGMSVKESINSIKIRAKAKELIAKLKVPFNPYLIALANEQLREFLIKEQSSAISKFRTWLNTAKKEYAIN